jgi:hypothetical protein
VTEKADFNAEEWSTILEGPATAGMIAVAAEKGGTIRESVQIAKVYAEAAKQHEGPELLTEIVSSRPEVDSHRYQSRESLQTDGMARVKEATDLLEQKAQPDEVDAYKKFVMAVAEHAAEAHKEGGFLGIGGTEVTDKEQAVLDELASTLGVSGQQASKVDGDG